MRLSNQTRVRARRASVVLALGVGASLWGVASGCSVADDSVRPAPISSSEAALVPARQWTAWAAKLPLSQFRSTYDTDRKEWLAFGGTNTNFGDPFSAPLVEAWQFGNSWALTVPRSRPTLNIAAAAYDSFKKRHMVIGGDQTEWEYDATNRNWQQLFAAGFTPTVRSDRFSQSNSSFIFEPSRSYAYLTTTTGLVVWDGATWTAAGALPDNAQADYARLVWDSKRSRLLAYIAGYSNATRVYAFSWPAATWSKVGNDLPARYSNQSLGATYDPVADALVTVGYPSNPANNAPMETWSMALSTGGWARNAINAPPDTYVNAPMDLGYDVGNQKVTLAAASQDPNYRTKFYKYSTANDTWVFDAVRSGAVALPGGYTAGAMTDLASHRMLTVSRAGYNPGGALEVWSFDGTQFSKISANNAGPSTDASDGNVSTAFDLDRRRIVVTIAYPGFDTWEFDVDNQLWQKAQPSVAFSSDSVLAYDATQKKTVRFDGATWLWNGSTWSKAVGSGPPARTGEALAYDIEGKRTVLWGGVSQNDTWSFTSNGWSNITGVTAPPQMSTPRMAYDNSAKHLLVFPTQYSNALIWEFGAQGWEASTTTPFETKYSTYAAYVPGRNSIALFRNAPFVLGGNDARIWFSDAYGPGCNSDADCGSSLYCTDGVCCGAKSCGTCETCNGTSVGQCTPITNAEDPNSCNASTQSVCDAKGRCSKANGAISASAASCGSGFLANGVCCNEACDGLCQACTAGLKTSGDRTGVCGASNAGVVDTQNRCMADPQATCQQDGMCDGRGACRLYQVGTGCGELTCTDNRATGSICNGLGACSVSATGQSCGGYVCQSTHGCPSKCDDDNGCVSTHRCDAGVCVAREGSHCEGNAVVDSAGQKKDCGAYACAAGACPEACVAYTDCVSGFVCSSSGQCTAPTVQPADSSGCHIALIGARTSNPLWGASIVAALLVARKRRHTRAQSTRL